MLTDTSRKKLVFVILAAIYLLLIITSVVYYFSHLDHGLKFIWLKETREYRVLEVNSSLPISDLVKIGDRLLAIDETPINSRRSFNIKSSELLHTHSASFSFKREEESFTVEIQAVPWFPEVDSVGWMLIGLINIALGFWLFMSRPGYEAAVMSGLGAFLSGCSLLLNIRVLFPHDLPGALTRLGFIGGNIFALAFFLHFTLVFPRSRGLFKKSWVKLLIYIVPSFILIIRGYNFFSSLASKGSGPGFSGFAPGVLAGVTSTYIVIYYALALIAMITTFILTREKAERHRILWILFASTIYLTVNLSQVISKSMLNSANPFPGWLLIVLAGLSPIAFFYAIVRHRALGIEVIVRKGLVYSTISIILLLITIGLYFAVFTLPFTLVGPERVEINPLIRQLTVATWAFILALIFTRIKRELQNFIDRRFYRKKYNYRQELKRIGSMLEKTAEKEKFLAVILENGRRTVSAESAIVALIKTNGEAKLTSSDEISLDDPTLSSADIQTIQDYFSSGRDFAGSRELGEDIEESSQRTWEVMKSLRADICLPIQNENKLFGFLFLGRKLSELDYNSADIELLKLLTDQAATGFDKLRLISEVSEKKKILRELEIGREIQQALLPSSVPALRGATFAVQTVPAMEVGGDFYTFIEYSPTRLGVVVGDIVGKGVAGAIRMAATISSMRVIANKNTSVASAMQHLNHELIRSFSSRYFAAMLFVIIDTETMELTWCNAGLPEPVVISAEGNSRFLEMSKYPLPPGASDRTEFHEERMELQEGDLLCFYTDGIVEARSSETQDEEFGYDRLVDDLKSNYSDEPQEILVKLNEKLDNFLGSEKGSDDLTILVMKLNK